jgi:hypothetical protein
MTSTALLAGSAPADRAPVSGERRAFRPGPLGNWLLVWVGLLNAPFAVMWFLGGPPRLPQIVLAAGIGYVARGFPAWQRQALFVAALAYGALCEVAAIFNLELTSLLHSIRFLLELDPASSAQYAAAGVLLLAAGSAGAILAARPMRFDGLKPTLAALAAVAAAAGIDLYANHDLQGHYGRTAPNGIAFESAATSSGWAAPAEGRPHKLLVMVESLGVPSSDPDMRRALFAAFRDPRLRERYEVTTGTTAYFSSTTAGEVRELCGRWSDYHDLLGRRDDGCLPARLRDDGYRTLGWHSFEGEFFDRAAWYPNVGFEERKFGPDLLRDGAELCGGVFPGACDRDIPRMIGARLAEARQPTFLYWLTLNTHLPVPAGANLETGDCARISPRLARETPMICRQLELWRQLDAALVRALTADGFPVTDVLIVGDHMPPYFERSMRTRFASDRVPWIRLKPRTTGPSREHAT